MNKIVILFFLVLSMFTSCSGKKDTANSDDSSLEKDMIKLTEQQQSLAGIATSPLERTINPEVIHCNGVIEIPSDARVSMYLPIGGYVSEIYVLTGDKVKKGEVLAVLEHPDYIALQQQYIESHAQMLFYQSEWERQQKLQVENATMQRTLDKAKADYLGALSQTKALESKMEMLGINTETLLAGKVSNKVYLRSPVN
ncbi:MAG: efflux RND transporter periplasmic adaptor subunit, partial [Flavobacteriales bacterium]|nr:efflux RND transporter periplasmic adaptor subunit [Flavobacteriales bacterium]